MKRFSDTMMLEKRNLRIFIIAFSTISFISSLESNGVMAMVRITYIANEGFLISSGSQKIAMDALFEGYHSGDHVESSNETIDKMIKCEDPFDSADLITISHEHLDHVSPDIVGKHLECNPVCMVICSHDVANMMRNYAHYEQIKDRIKEKMPELNSVQCDTVHDIPIKILGSRHAMTQFRNILNLGFVFNLDGINIYHSGDSWGEYVEELEAFQLNNENIDIAFLHYNFFKVPDVIPDLRTGVQKVKQYINPKYIILMHVSPAENDIALALKDSIENDFEGVLFFENSMDNKTFTDLSSMQENKSHLPTHHKLFQNYPNPFNPSTTIRYCLNLPSNVKLSIYNIHGQEINTLINQYTFPGEHSISWDGTNKMGEKVDSGVYVYGMMSSDYHEKKKMLFIK